MYIASLPCTGRLCRLLLILPRDGVQNKGFTPKSGPGTAGTRSPDLSWEWTAAPPSVLKPYPVPIVKAGAESLASLACARIPYRPPVIIPVILVGAPAPAASAAPASTTTITAITTITSITASAAPTAASITTHIKTSFNKYDYGILYGTDGQCVTPLRGFSILLAILCPFTAGPDIYKPLSMDYTYFGTWWETSYETGGRGRV